MLRSCHTTKYHVYRCQWSSEPLSSSPAHIVQRDTDTSGHFPIRVPTLSDPIRLLFRYQRQRAKNLIAALLYPRSFRFNPIHRPLRRGHHYTVTLQNFSIPLHASVWPVDHRMTDMHRTHRHSNHAQSSHSSQQMTSKCPPRPANTARVNHSTIRRHRTDTQSQRTATPSMLKPLTQRPYCLPT